MTSPFLVCASVTLISALISLGFSVASVPDTSGKTRTLAFYTVARSVAFAVISVVPFFNGSIAWLEAAALGMTILQACDAVIGMTIPDRMKTFGPAGTAVANLAALIWLTST